MKDIQYVGNKVNELRKQAGLTVNYFVNISGITDDIPVQQFQMAAPDNPVLCGFWVRCRTVFLSTALPDHTRADHYLFREAVPALFPSDQNQEISYI